MSQYVLRRANAQDNCEIVEIEDLSDVPENLKQYSDELIEQISTILNDVGVVGVHLNNHAQLEHYFVLFNTDQGVFRLEAYSRVYIPRITQWDTWERDTSKLLTMEPSYALTMYWSGLFTVHLPEKQRMGTFFTATLII